MRRLLLLFLVSATAFSYVIEYSGSVDVYYRCSPYITEFGICYGDRTDLLFSMSLLAAVFTIIYFLRIQLAGLKPSTLVGYLAFVAAAMACETVALSGDVLVAVFYTAALSALAYTLVVSLGLSEALILALAALATVAIKGGEVLAASPYALNLQRCSCKTNLKDAKNQAYKKVEPIINAGLAYSSSAYLRIREF